MTKQYVPINTKGCFMDYTYCASPNCKNECGRKMSKEIKETLERFTYHRIAMGYFCGEGNEKT